MWLRRDMAAQVGLAKVEMRDVWTQVGLTKVEMRDGWTEGGMPAWRLAGLDV